MLSSLKPSRVFLGGFFLLLAHDLLGPDGIFPYISTKKTENQLAQKTKLAAEAIVNSTDVLHLSPVPQHERNESSLFDKPSLYVYVTM